ncbi:MAG: hypothetical protein ACRDQU_16930 [Pseudonocardiaceae bacterium]
MRCDLVGFHQLSHRSGLVCGQFSGVIAGWLSGENLGGWADLLGARW